jgi:hypothetical protein
VIGALSVLRCSAALAAAASCFLLGCDPGPLGPKQGGAPDAGAGGGAGTDATPVGRVVRLSHAQWENSVRDLLRLDAPSGLSAFRRSRVASPETRNPRAARSGSRQQSINDRVRGDLSALLGLPRLSAADRARLDLHLSSVRDIERALACGADAGLTQSVQDAASDSTDGDAVFAHVRLYMDIAALAVACGHTRAVTIQVGSGNDGSTRYHDPSAINHARLLNTICRRAAQAGWRPDRRLRGPFAPACAA